MDSYKTFECACKVVLGILIFVALRIVAALI